MLTLLDANNVIALLPHDKKERFPNIKLFRCYCEENGKPNIDWMKMSKAEYRLFRSSIACYKGSKKVTNPPTSSTINLS